MGYPVRKALIVGRSFSPLGELLIEEFCRISHSHNRIRLVGICEAARSSRLELRREKLISFLDPYARKIFAPGEVISWPIPRGLRRIARAYSLPYLEPPELKMNHPDFVEFLRKELKPDLLFSCYCPQLLKKPLLDTFSIPVNYHNGILPEYRGLRATEWSIYNAERETGFTFHLMNERFDEGPILYSDAVPIKPNSSCRELALQKTKLACRSLPEVLDLILDGSPGKPQTGRPAYYSAKDFREKTHIPEPERLSQRELLHRLRAFQVLRIRLGGRFYEVTEIKEVERIASSLSFTTADGISYRPTRFKGLPRWAYQVYVQIRGRSRG